jgi:nucleoside-diphosphate-sugar epimerase
VLDQGTDVEGRRTEQGVAKRIAVAGYGAVGRALATRLSARGDVVRIVQRQPPQALPAGAAFVHANLDDAGEAHAALAGVDAVVCAVGVPYVSQIYVRVWPILMRNLLGACAKSGARFVFADSLYMYGPQSRPLTEDMPLTNYGQKPRVRAEITRLWRKAHDEDLVCATAVRASDFYGPQTPTSVLSTMGVARLLAGKPALAPYPADQPHDFTYVPDFARALEALIDAGDDVYGEAWHVPNAPTRSLRELLVLAARLIGVRPRVTLLTPMLASLLGLLRSDVRELKEMRFQWDRPYLVDATKFSGRFWNDPTPFDDGLRATIASYRGGSGS